MTWLKNVLADKLVLSLVGVVSVLVVMASYLVSGVLDTPMLSRPNHVIVVLPSSGGIYAGSPVTYRGVRVGRISKVRINAQGNVEATAIITDPRPIPASSPVKVRSLSPVGEQYLDFQPTTPAGPFLEDGSHVVAEATDLPKTLASTVINVSKLLDQVDNDDLHTALTGVARALDGTGDDIGRLSDQGYELLRTMDQSWPMIHRLLTNGESLLQLGVDNADNIDTLSTSSRKFAAFLKAFDPELRRLLRVAPTQLAQLAAVIDSLDKVLPPVLDRIIKLTGIVALREPHFRELLRSYFAGINTISGAIRHGALRGHVLVATDYRCSYGGKRRDPRDAHRHPMDLDGQCDAPANRVLRGAKHAPAPTR